jgi:glycogen debranching enzyme
MHLGQDVLSDLRGALAREWVLGDGLGGSACGTAAGAATRRAHALLVVAEPHGRPTTLLTRLEERVLTAESSWDLACALGPDGAARAEGHLLLEVFRLDPWPVWRVRCGHLVFERALMLVPGHHAVSIAWRYLDGPPARLSVTPLLAARDPWALQREDPDLRGAAHGVPGRVRIDTVPGRPSLTLWHNGAFMPARVWRHALALPADPPGAGSCEDAFVPGYVEGAIAPGQSFHLVASSEEDLFRALAREDRLGAPPPRTLAGCVEALERAERARVAAGRRAALEGADFTARQAAAAHGGDGFAVARRSEPLVDADDPWVGPLALDLLAGLTRRGHRLTLVVGLPGAEERGADALRAVAGLVALRAFGPAREVLRGYAEYLNEGLAPEAFDRLDGTPRYGDPAPALWLVHASELYVRRSDDVAFLRDTLYPALESVMQFYRAGTRHGVRVDADGLLAAGEGAAAVRRAGVNALWSHALVAMAQLARLAGRRESGAFYLAWAREHQRAFAESFWDTTAGCLYEALGPAGPVRGLSPGQVLAVALVPPLLSPERAQRLVATLEHELVTPYGLREAPGAEVARPEWLGPWHAARLRVMGRSDGAHRGARHALERLLGFVRAHGGHVPERVRLSAGAPDEAPLGPAGDVLSVVATAELLRARVEEFDLARAPVGAGAGAR